MGVAFICDCCGKPAKQDACATITIKKKSKAKDIFACPGCTKLLWDGKLGQEQPVTSIAKKRQTETPESQEENLTQEQRILEEKIERKSQERQTNIATVAPVDAANGVCVHYNKRLHYAGNHAPYYKCNDCGSKLAYENRLSPRDRSDLVAPKDVNVTIKPNFDA